jgi:hypothetical protein
MVMLSTTEDAIERVIDSAEEPIVDLARHVRVAALNGVDELLVRRPSCGGIAPALNHSQSSIWGFGGLGHYMRMVT